MDREQDDGDPRDRGPLTGGPQDKNSGQKRMSSTNVSTERDVVSQHLGEILTYVKAIHSQQNLNELRMNELKESVDFLNRACRGMYENIKRIGNDQAMATTRRQEGGSKAGTGEEGDQGQGQQEAGGTGKGSQGQRQIVERGTGEGQGKEMQVQVIVTDVIETVDKGLYSEVTRQRIDERARQTVEEKESIERDRLRKVRERIEMRDREEEEREKERRKEYEKERYERDQRDRERNGGIPNQLQDLQGEFEFQGRNRGRNRNRLDAWDGRQRMESVSSQTESRKEKSSMTPVQSMFARASLKIGLRPITEGHVRQWMKYHREKEIEEYDTEEKLKEAAMKSATRDFLMNELSMTDENINRLEITERVRPRNVNTRNVVYIKVKDKKAAAMLLSHSRYIDMNSNSGKVSLEKFIPSQAFDRYKAVEAKAYNIRDIDGLRTDVRLGKEDFELRVKPKGDKRAWTDIEPKELDDDMPNINMSSFNLPNKSSKERTQRVSLNESNNEEDVLMGAKEDERLLILTSVLEKGKEAVEKETTGGKEGGQKEKEGEKVGNVNTREDGDREEKEETEGSGRNVGEGTGKKKRKEGQKEPEKGGEKEMNSDRENEEGEVFGNEREAEGTQTGKDGEEVRKEANKNWRRQPNQPRTGSSRNAPGGSGLPRVGSTSRSSVGKLVTDHSNAILLESPIK
jgi:hypothetical protein